MALLRVKTAFALAHAVYPVGARVDSCDPAVKGREHLFEPAPESPVVEAATAVPGEKRSTPRKAAAKKAAALKVGD